MTNKLTASRSLTAQTGWLKVWQAIAVLCCLPMSSYSAAGALAIELQHGQTGKQITEQRIDIYELLNNGERKWRARENTNAKGIANFNLEGLGEGKKFTATAVVFNDFRVTSEPVANSGKLLFRVGTTKIKLLNGSVAGTPPLADSRVDIRRKVGNKYQWFGKANTNQQGVILVDLPSIDNGQIYALKARSTANGDYKQSANLTRSGSHTFVVGNPPLNLTLKDAKTGTALSDVPVTAYEVSSDGGLQWLTRRSTDASGNLVFDLNGIGSGRRFKLKTKIYNNFRATSSEITQPGNLAWSIGDVRIRVMDGSKQPAIPYASRDVTIQGKKTDGKYGWYSKATTDAAGLLKLNLPGLADGKSYRLQAKSLVDGKSRYSSEITSTGDTSFTVGNIPLTVKLIDDANGQGISNLQVTAYQQLGDGSLQWYTRQSTDAGGQVVFDLPGLGSGNKYRLKTKAFSNQVIQSDVISEPGQISWRTGKVRITVVQGQSIPRAPLTDTKVIVEKKKPDGKFSWYTHAFTDSSGLLRVDLDKIGQGQTYRLRAASPVNGSTKYSQELTRNGEHQFVVGNVPLAITLVDDKSNSAISGIKVTAWEIRGDGSRQWRTRQNTDSNGLANFDLDGLGDGRKYQLQFSAFNKFNYYSDLYQQPGQHTLRLGTTRISVLNGSVAPNAPLSAVKIQIQKLSDEGKFKWFSHAETDANGQLKLDLPSVNKGAVYRLSAASQVTEQHKYSQKISAAGEYDFVVGNPALTVRLVNALSGNILSDQQVTVYELGEDGKRQWITRRETDDQGLAVFDLAGVGTRQYVLRTKPYNGGHVYSPLIVNYGNFDFAVGSLPLTLVNTANQQTIAGKEVTAYAVQADGSKKWTKKGTTDGQGKILFDLEGLQTGQNFVFKTHNPFGQNKRYYSSLVTAAGPFEFAITNGDTDPPDIEPPEVVIQSPISTGLVAAEGFILSGIASDNKTLSRVTVTITSAGVNAFTTEAELDANTGNWQLSIAENQLTPEASVSVTVTAYDAANNTAVTEAGYQVAAALTDAEAPTIAVNSHRSGDSVSKTGVILQGIATDDVGVTQLLATVVDPVLGSVIDAQPLSLSTEGGNFELVIRNGQMTVDRNITITLVASDNALKSTTVELVLSVQQASNEPVQMLSRLTFGATPELVDYIATVGPDGFFGEQLMPMTIDDSAFETMISGFYPQTPDELKQYALQHMLYSRRQLREVLTWFWDNHFNTNFYTHDNVGYEVAENNGFREHALGRFRDLLEVSAKSPAMIIYLNNAENLASAPNENYAREVMELHTMGVDGGYTSADVAALAKIFSGWHVRNDAFFFNGSEHNFEDKIFLGQNITGSGLNEGGQALDILASHPATASYICTKLAQLLVTDDPSNALVTDCATTFQNTDGNITRVVERLVLSPEFSDPAFFRNKVKTPLEMVTSVVRNFDAAVDYRDLDSAMRRMGMNLFLNSVPTGWSEMGSDWINTNLLLQRARFVNDVAFNTNASRDNYIDIVAQMTDRGLNSAEAIVAHLLQVTEGGDYSALEYQIGIDILNAGSEPFDINGLDAETRLRRLLGHILSYPGYQFQ